MVVSIPFSDLKEFNLFCRLQKLKREEIISIFHEKGKLILVLDRGASELSEWNSRKTAFMKELMEPSGK